MSLLRTQKFPPQVWLSIFQAPASSPAPVRVSKLQLLLQGPQSRARRKQAPPPCLQGSRRSQQPAVPPPPSQRRDRSLPLSWQIKTWSAGRRSVQQAILPHLQSQSLLMFRQIQ